MSESTPEAQVDPDLDVVMPSVDYFERSGDQSKIEHR